MIIPLYNTAASQGKSTLSTLIANEFGLRYGPGRVALLDLDLVNTNGETLTHYIQQTPDMLRPFDFFNVDTWRDDGDRYRLVIVDCSKTPDQALRDLVKAEADAVLIPAKEDKDLSETIDCMREMFLAQVKTGLIINGFSAAVADRLEATGQAFQADRLADIPQIDGIYDLISTGDLPQNKPKTHKTALRIRNEFKRVCDDIERWLNVFVAQRAA